MSFARRPVKFNPPVLCSDALTRPGTLSYPVLPCMETLEGRLFLSAALDALANARDVVLAPTAAVTVSGAFAGHPGYTFTATATGKVRVDALDGTAGKITIRNHAGTQLTKLNAKANKDAAGTFSVKEGQTYYVIPEAGSGRFTLTLTSIPKDDLPNNTIDTPKYHKATASGGLSAEGTINYDGNHDYRAFVARVDGWMTIALFGQTDLSPALAVTDGNGKGVGSDSASSGSAAHVTFYASAGVAYTLDLSADPGSTGRYKLVGKTVPDTPPTPVSPISPAPAPSPSPTPNIGSVNVYAIDRDGDGYGLGCPLGPDADDNDPTVNTYASALKKHGSDQAILTHRYGFGVRRILYVSPTGSDSTAVAGDAGKPFATAEAALRQAQPGDAVILRAGTYKAVGTNVINLNNLHGTSTSPIVIAGMPGERVVLDTAGNDDSCIKVENCSHLIIDNFLLDNTGQSGMGRGMTMTYCHNILVQQSESRNHFWGVIAMQDLHNITWDNLLVHDNTGEHGLYIGARELPDSHITISNSVIYGNHWQGIQLNGRVSNATLENNIIHSNGQAGIQFIQGVSNSLVRNNLIFNNGKQGIVLYMYDSSDPNIAPYNQTGNLFEYNTVWVGELAPPGGEWGPGIYDAVLFNDSTSGQRGSLANNTFRYNVFVTSEGAAFKYTDSQWASRTTVTGNLFFRTHGDTGVLRTGATALDASGINSLGGSWTANRYADPLFVNVKPAYNKTPDAFDFDLLAESPAKTIGFKGV